jgi:hypothetical protein
MQPSQVTMNIFRHLNAFLNERGGSSVGSTGAAVHRQPHGLLPWKTADGARSKPYEKFEVRGTVVPSNIQLNTSTVPRINKKTM